MAGAVAFMKAKHSLVGRCKEKYFNSKKKKKYRRWQKFKALANRFWLPSKSCWFNKIVHS